MKGMRPKIVCIIGEKGKKKKKKNKILNAEALS